MQDIQALRDSADAHQSEAIFPPTGTPAIESPLSLPDAIEYAEKYNFEAAVKRLEEKIEQERLTGARLKMLPSLTVGGEISERSNYPASYSSALFSQAGGAQAYNYSKERQTRTYSMELSWDLLDFSAAYYQARQAENRVHIAEQQRRRVLQNLKLDVVKSFWRLQAAGEALEMAKEMASRLEQRIKILKQQLSARLVSEIEVLETAIALSEIKMRICALDYDYQRHKYELANLMGVPDYLDFAVIDVDFNVPLVKMGLDRPRLERTALKYRPELYEQDFEALITRDDARIEAVKMAPNISLFMRHNYDDDMFLYNSEWQTAGLKVSFDLLSLPQQWSRRNVATGETERIRSHRLALSAAILTQVNISAVEYRESFTRYTQLAEIGVQRKRLMNARRRHAESGRGNMVDVLKSEAAYLLAQTDYLSAYADVMIAEERIFNTIGDEAMSDYLMLYKKTPITAASVEEAIVNPEAVLAREIERMAEDVNTQAAVAEVPRPAEKMPVPVKKTPRPVEKMPAPFVKTPRPVEKMPATYAKKPSMLKKPVHLHDGQSRFPYSLQLSSWQEFEQARQVLQAYKKQGVSPYLIKINLEEKGVWWRVYTGYYRTLDAAEAAKTKLGMDHAVAMKTPYATLIGRYEREEQAREEMARVAGRGYSPYMVMFGKRVSVFVGAYFDREKAEAVTARLTEEGFSSRTVLR